MAEKCEFPWLLSNITDKNTDLPLANGKIKHMMDWHGVKVGLHFCYAHYISYEIQ